MMRSIFTIFLLALLPALAISQERTGTRRALILCGLPGNEEHRELFTESVLQIHNALTNKLGFEESAVRIHLGRSEEEPAPTVFPTHGRGTAEEIAAEAKRLIQRTTANDLAWVFVIGHSYYDGRTVHFNIPDQDITHLQFSKLFDRLNGEQNVFFICTPVSGFYIKTLSRSNRVVITSTEADVETNGSIFHTALAETLTEIDESDAFDLDKDGTVSLFDLYVKSTQNLSDLYLENDPPLVATEHPQLDDNGDGRGSELQIDYLTVEQGGRSDAKRRRNFRKFKDGPKAASMSLMIAISK